jgi:O-antigen ligase
VGGGHRGKGRFAGDSEFDRTVRLVSQTALIPLPYNLQTEKRKSFFLFVLLELLAIAGSFLFGYKILLIPAAVGTVLFFSFWDVRVTLVLAVAFSTLIQYGAKEKTLLEMSAFTLILISLIVAVYAGFCLKGLRIKRSKLDLPLMALLSISLLTVVRGILNHYNMALAGFELYAFLCFAVVFLVVNLFDSPTAIRRSFYALVLVALYSAMIGLAAYFRAGHRIGGHLFGAFPAMIALVLLNLSFYSQKRRERLLYILISLPLILHLVCSFTRGYWFGFLGGLGISYAAFVWQTEASWQRRSFVFMRAVFFGGILVYVLLVLMSSFLPTGNLPSDASRRLESSFAWAPFSSAFARLIEYKACWNRIWDSPVFGHGFGYVLEYKDPFSSRLHSQWYIHQSYLYIALKMGFLGLLAFIWMFYVFFRHSIRKCMRIQSPFFKGLTFGFMGNAVQLLIAGLTNYEFAAVVNTCYLAFAMGAVLVVAETWSRDPLLERIP